MLAAYGLTTGSIQFLPLGADRDTSVYRIVARDGSSFFLRLRKGEFQEASVRVPAFLHEQGLSCILPPLATASGSLWTDVGLYQASLYPYLESRNAYEAPLSERQWADLGRAFERIHHLPLPEDLLSSLAWEDWSPVSRPTLRAFLETGGFDKVFDPLGQEVAGFLRKQSSIILDLIERAETLAHSLKDRQLAFCLCHADLHAGNILMQASGDFHIVDWDEAMLAPKERDLMSVGADLFGSWHSPAEEETLFYQGYGAVEIDRQALAYYRCQRVIDDLAVECEQIFAPEGDPADKAQSYRWMASNFTPGGTIELADRTLED